MADYYTHFSAVVDNVPAEAEEWIKQVLDFRPSKVAEGETRAYEILSDMLGQSLGHNVELYNWPYFCHKIEKAENGALSLWLYSEEGLDDDHLIAFVQGLIRKYMPDYIFKVSFACTCSKPRVDAFGGYWLVVSKDDVDGGNTWDAAQAVQEQMKEQMKK